jgi:hypothetical protein
VGLKWAGGILLQTLAAGCGTLLYPERRGQPAGRLDWRVVLLDGIGLLFFFIPGVIAFAVDFLNGTIYLPNEPGCEPARMTKTRSGSSRLRAIKVARSDLRPGKLEAVVLRETGKAISLEHGDYVTRELNSIDQFWETRSELEGDSPAQPVS